MAFYNEGKYRKSFLAPFKISDQKYQGDVSADNYRHGHGVQMFHREYRQKYEGNFVYDNLHGYGKYTYLNKDPRLHFIYEGTFNNNKYDGYGKVFFDNGSTFEGCFKNDRRTGPGVFTYEDGTQDVGLYYNNCLIRLAKNVSPEWVPKLAKSPAGKVKLLKYKQLLPTCEPLEDRAKEILNTLTEDPVILARSDELYNNSIRKEDSIFFNTRLYNELLHESDDCTIDVACIDEPIIKITTNNEEGRSESENTNLEFEQKMEMITSPSTNAFINYFESYMLGKDLCECNDKYCGMDYDCIEKFLNENQEIHFKNVIKQDLDMEYPVKKVDVEYIFAINNNDIDIELLMVSFKNRNLEGNVSFDVGKLMKSDRSGFGEPGLQEKILTDFLMYCSEGNHRMMEDLVYTYSVDNDVSDAAGNCGKYCN